MGIQNKIDTSILPVADETIDSIYKAEGDIWMKFPSIEATFDHVLVEGLNTDGYDAFISYIVDCAIFPDEQMCGHPKLFVSLSSLCAKYTGIAAQAGTMQIPYSELSAQALYHAWLDFKTYSADIQMPLSFCMAYLCHQLRQSQINALNGMNVPGRVDWNSVGSVIGFLANECDNSDLEEYLGKIERIVKSNKSRFGLSGVENLSNLWHIPFYCRLHR